MSDLVLSERGDSRIHRRASSRPIGTSSSSEAALPTSPTRWPGGGDARVLDVRGRIVMPGLCDAHVHVTAVTPDFALLRRWSPTYVASRAGLVLRDMLMRGFTTVRDVGGADWGLARAVEEGHLIGPRLLFCGHAISQTGGHGDMRGPGEDADEPTCLHGLGRVVDGVPAVRAACRDEIRKGATHLKLMCSGGVASPTDRISNTQFATRGAAGGRGGGGGRGRLRDGPRVHAAGGGPRGRIRGARDRARKSARRGHAHAHEAARRPS